MVTVYSLGSKIDLSATQDKTLGFEEQQKMAPQNMSLWHKDYFELKTTKEKQEKLPHLPLLD